MRKPLSHAQRELVLAFALTKPADERYVFWDGRTCVLAQVSKMLFPGKENHFGTRSYLGYIEDGSYVEFFLGDGHTFSRVSCGSDTDDETQHTWGAFTARLEQAMEGEHV